MMKNSVLSIQINIKALHDQEIGIRQAVFLSLLDSGYVSYPDDFLMTEEEIEELVKKEYLWKLSDGIYRPSPKVKTLFPPDITTEDFNKVFLTNDIQKLAEEYRNIFPKGVTSGGYLVRGDRQGIQKKLKKFLENYPEFSPERILAATRKYVNEMRLKGYPYMKLAHYFIEKDGVSALASYCESIKETSQDFEEGDSFEKSLN